MIGMRHGNGSTQVDQDGARMSGKTSSELDFYVMITEPRNDRDANQLRRDAAAAIMFTVPEIHTKVHERDAKHQLTGLKTGTGTDARARR